MRDQARVPADSPDQAAPPPRLVSMSRSGRHVAIRQRSAVAIVDALGTAPRVALPCGNPTDFACVGDQLWVVIEGQLRRHALAEGTALGDPAPLADGARGRLLPVRAADATVALWWAESVSLVSGEAAPEPLEVSVGEGGWITPLGGRRLLIVEPGALRVHDAGRGDVETAALPQRGAITGVAPLFGNRAFVVSMRDGDTETFAVLRPNGSLVHLLSASGVRRCAVAETRGLALALTDEGLLAIDLRYGKTVGAAKPPLPVSDLEIDADAKYVVLAGFDGSEQLAVAHLPYTDLFGGKRARAAEPTGDDEPERGDEPDAQIDAADTAALPAEPTEPGGAERAAPVVIPQIPLAALGRVLEPLEVQAPAGVAPYGSTQEYLGDLLELVTAQVARAIADAWDSGRLSLPTGDTRPFESEVNALIGKRGGGSETVLQTAERRLAEATAVVGRRTQASLARGVYLPFIELVREFDLTHVGSQVMLVVAAPALRGEIARLFGILSNDEHRPICDRFLVELVLGTDAGTRLQIAHELSVDAPLVRHGLVRVAPASNDQYLFAPLTVDPVLLARLRGERFAGAGDESVTTIREADRSLEELSVPDELKRDLVLALAQPPRDGRPVRLLLRGRPGSGRRSVLAALAARVQRPLAVIDADRLPRGGRAFSDRMRMQLRRAVLRGALPCVSGIEVFESEDPEGREHLKALFRSHAGPIVFRVSPEYTPPLDPGYLSFVVPGLTESQRLSFWREALARRGMVAAGVEQLASRFRIGPGTIETVIATAAARREGEAVDDADASSDLDDAARQHIATRLSNVATHVTRLARWETVALPDDVIDSIREFVGRVKHRRTVYDQWGFDRKVTSARGLTALFYGPPGTGKSMVAGLIARELGLDLHRVDLARITSKWIGETEKNLAQIFDAAEDGQAVILFDEADSLFAKRTEVKSSVDRYANLEVNYLLTRLDTFEGVAILTTNLEGSMDNAFKRRLSLRLAFPFPDEEMRVRLWAAHIPAELPISGDLDFADLSRRFPMSGGYIRNSALRAAFLAAQEGVALSHEHLERAIHLEYREMGKLSPGGKMV